MILDEKILRAVSETQKAIEKVMLFYDPNCPKTDQAAKDLYLAALFMNKTLERILAEQSFTERDATHITRESLKQLRRAKL